MQRNEELLLKWMNGDCTSAEEQELYTHYPQKELLLLDSSLDSEQIAIKDPYEMLKELNQNQIARPVKSKNTWLLGVLFLGSILAIIAYLAFFGPLTIKNESSFPMAHSLPDKTQILIGPGSEISYDEDGFVEDRKVLLDGDAYFDVTTKGKFVVEAVGFEVEVLGTQFEIHQVSNKEGSVSVYEGTVRVTSGVLEETLKIGERVEVKSKSMIRAKINKKAKPTMKGGDRIYNSVLISDIFDELSLYYGVRFVGKLPEDRFSGNLPTQDLAKCLEILDISTSYKFTLKDDEVLVD